MIDLKRLAEYEQNKLQTMDAAEIFRFFCLKLLDADYVMGRENIFETDCSGTICFPLFCMGLNVRVTAGYLYHKMFLNEAGDWHDYLHRVMAVFYGKHGNVSHVSPIVGRGVILDAVNPEQPVSLKAMALVFTWYEKQDYTIHVKELDWAAARQVARMTEHSWEREADEILKEMIE